MRRWQIEGRRKPGFQPFFQRVFVRLAGVSFKARVSCANNQDAELVAIAAIAPTASICFKGQPQPCIVTYIGGLLCKHANSMAFFHSLTYSPGNCTVKCCFFFFSFLFSSTHTSSLPQSIFDLATVAHPPLYLTTYQTGQEIIQFAVVSLKMHGLAYH